MAILLERTKGSTYPEEKVEGKNIEVSLVFNVQQFKNILKRCWLLHVFQCQYKVKIGLVVLKQGKRHFGRENCAWPNIGNKNGH